MEINSSCVADVAPRTSVHISNPASDPLLICIEPWAVEFELPSRSYCEVVSVGGVLPIVIDVEAHDDRVVFWIETRGAIYEYWQDGQLVD